MNPPHAVLLGLLCACGLAADVGAQAEPELFRAHESSLFKVEVVEALSGAPYITGTAFVVDATGRLMTNYHVVNDVVFSPDEYSLRLIGVDGVDYDTRVVGVDPVNDLAVLRADLKSPSPLTLATRRPDVGEAVFSLGFPSDLSGTLVSGTFSGPIERTLASHLHYSGSLSPGMSGGPTIDRGGNVVGINVATSGNQLSYLVSVDAARRLLADDSDHHDLMGQAHESLLEFQRSVRRQFVDPAMPTRAFDSFEVGVLSEDAAECSASPLRPDGYVFTGVVHQCTSADGIWLDPDESVSPLSVKHVLVVADGMSRLRFSGLYTEWFQDVAEWEARESRWVSDFTCARRNVTNGAGVKLRLSQCWRRREGFDGLYDVLAKTAILGVRDRGLVTTIAMRGTTPDNGQEMILRLVESVRWHR